ncbi:MAG: DUF4870 domain-containing protein [Coriobacteriia bacterium]|nr:DUF4870 domain-containing protein [Coriobacteriia bacterium]
MSDDFQAPPPGPAAPPPAAGGDAPSDNGKIFAALGYIVGIVALIAILMEPYKNEKFVRHHAIQAIALWVGWIVASVITAIPYVGWVAGPIIYIALLVFAVMGCIKAFNNEMWEMPLVYNLVKQYI